MRTYALVGSALVVARLGLFSLLGGASAVPADPRGAATVFAYLLAPLLVAYAIAIAVDVLNQRRRGSGAGGGRIRPSLSTCLRAAAAAPWISSSALWAIPEVLAAAASLPFAVGFLVARRLAGVLVLAVFAVVVGLWFQFVIAFSVTYYASRIDATVLSAAYAALVAGTFLSPGFAVAGAMVDRSGRRRLPVEAARPVEDTRGLER
jgi:hypothetical protein